MPMSLLILRGTFQSIPRALEEAAYLDGAGFLRTFFQIVMPCAKGDRIKYSRFLPRNLARANT